VLALNACLSHWHFFSPFFLVIATEFAIVAGGIVADRPDSIRHFAILNSADEGNMESDYEQTTSWH
jgi:hypothetical protein